MFLDAPQTICRYRLASTANSAFNGNLGWTLTNSTATKASALESGARAVNWEKTANVLNKAGKFFSVGSLIYDVSNARSDYQECMKED
jgi:hypothetical protein